jgi:hypothetical protein
MSPLVIGSTLVDSSNRVRDVELASLVNALFSIFYKKAIHELAGFYYPLF